MQLEYIDKNLNRIIQNPDSVLYLRPYGIENKRALFAMVREDQGVYRKVQITKEQSKMTFPWEPIYWFYNGPGCVLLKDYILFHNMLALNPAHLDGFIDKELDENKIFNIGIFATFDDGSATFVERKRKKEFEKKGGIQPYIELLKQQKICNSVHETYEVIEWHNVSGDSIVISEIQGKVPEKSNAKRLVLNKSTRDY